ncbi:MAG: hypothetical protein K0Q72_1427 [Armatimonadetes bacterium]|nr:hypothetical protein [Armatimonadota bacterium]
MDRRNWLIGAAGAVLSMAFARPGIAAPPADVPGEEVVQDLPTPALLASFLPPFKAVLLERAPDAASWNTLRLSPTGKYLLAEVRVGLRQSVLLLDPDGGVIRDLTTDRFASARGLWGASDQQVLLECRAEPSSRPRYLKYNPVSEGNAPALVPGLPEWAPGGKDYLLAIAAGERLPGRDDGPVAFQRYSVTNDPVGRPLPADDPTWSGDGQWLAFLGRPGMVPSDAASTLQLLEVRVLPARGDVPRVVVSRAGWDRLARENGWSEATGPDDLVWAPAGDALFGICKARTGRGDEHFLVRMDLRTARRDVLPLPERTEIVTTSADARHWVLRMDERLFRLDFEAPAAPKKRPPATSVEPTRPKAG